MGVKTTLLRVVFLSLLFFGSKVHAQTTPPFTIPPKWKFGYKCGIDFTSGSPVFLAGNPIDISGGNYSVGGLEASTTACDSSKNILFYSNSVHLYNGADAQVIGPAAGSTPALITGGSSSTDGSIAVPDPADPFNAFFLITANDRTGGGGGSTNLGINYHRVVKSGATVTVSAATNLCGNVVDETLHAGSDLAGGYWIVSHGTGDNTFRVWHLTSGGFSAMSTQAVSPWVSGTSNGSIKISPCQDKIGWIGNNYVVVRQWDPLTGTVGANIYTSAAPEVGTLGYGFEFSPDGSKVYFSDLTGHTLYQIDLATSTKTTLSTASSNTGNNEIGTMQIGPDSKIYVTNGAYLPSGVPLYVGVVNDPNNAGAGCNYSSTGFTLSATTANYPYYYRGLVNEPYHNPSDPQLFVYDGADCNTKVLTFNFKTYFRDSVTIKPGSIEWDFKNTNTWVAGSKVQSYNYGADGTYTTKVRFRDLYCDRLWTAQIPVTISCPMPANFISLTAMKKDNATQLDWKCSCSGDITAFAVLYSTDGVNFSKIDQVHIGESIVGVRSFSHTVMTDAQNDGYFKIEAIRPRGVSSFSKMVSISANASSFEVYPNPFAQEFFIAYSGFEDTEITISDVYGKVVEQFHPDAEAAVLRVGSNLPIGTYYVTITSPKETRVSKVIKY